MCNSDLTRLPTFPWVRALGNRQQMTHEPVSLSLVGNLCWFAWTGQPAHTEIEMQGSRTIEVKGDYR